MKRVGVFICHCGTNISANVDSKHVAEVSRRFPHVYYATDYMYMCSDPGQEKIIQAIKEHNLNRIVVASCSPRLHEFTFQKTLERAGLNPYLLEMANIREQCSWVHSRSRDLATAKAIDLVRMMVAKVSENVPLQRPSVLINKKALVIGGGITGIQAAIDIADAGYPVVLVERDNTIGGKMAMLDKTFPTLDCSG
jgi:heterodisulfide reductase subunit A